MAAIRIASLKDTSLDLINLMMRVSEKIGAAALKDFLKDIDKKTPTLSDDRLIEETVKAVAIYYKQKPIFFTDKEKYSRNETKYWGIIYITAILYKYSGLKRGHIADLFGLTDKAIGNKIGIFEKLDRENRMDIERLIVYDQIELMLINKRAIKKKQ
jgi:hypothetical protein